MASHPLSPRVRKELETILAEDRPKASEVLSALRRMREKVDVSPFSAAVELLLTVRMAEPDAERLFGGILEHRSSLQASLGRDPGLRVAAADYFFELHAGSGQLERTVRPQSDEEAGEPAWDPACALPGPAAFAAELEREIRRSRRHGLGFALVRVDFGGLLASARPFGLLLCDEVLKNSARTLRRALRETDRAGRIAEEEFGLLLPETDRLGARAAAERVLSALSGAAPSPAAGLAASTCVAAGAACFPDDGLSAESLRERAAQALQRARQSDGTRVEAHHVERRAFPRRMPSPALFVDVTVVDGAGPRAAEPLNVSRSGILLDASGRFRPQEQVVVGLSLSAGGEPPARLVLPGRVVRVATGRDPARGARIGIEFEAPLAQEWPAVDPSSPTAGSRTTS